MTIHFLFQQIESEAGEGQGWNISMVDIAFMNPALCSAGGCTLTNVLFPESRNIFVRCPGAGSRVQTGAACF